MTDERFHLRVDREHIPGGVRFTCQDCGACVSIPAALFLQWAHEGRIDAEIEPRLTRTLLLSTHSAWPMSRGHLKVRGR